MVFRLIALLPVLTGVALAADPVSAPAPAVLQSAGGGAPAEPESLIGRIDHGRYFSASGAFSCAVPRLDKDTGLITDSQTTVEFKDQKSVYCIIAAFAIPAAQKFELEATSPKDFLVRFFSSYVLVGYQKDCPTATIEEPAKFIPELSGGALLVYTRHPGGSQFAVDSLAVAKSGEGPPVAKRGSLIFVNQGHIVMISMELAERITKKSLYNLSKEKEDKILWELLISAVKAMEFYPPKETAAPAAAPAGK